MKVGPIPMCSHSLREKKVLERSVDFLKPPRKALHSNPAILGNSSFLPDLSCLDGDEVGPGGGGCVQQEGDSLSPFKFSLPPNILKEEVFTTVNSPV